MASSTSSGMVVDVETTVVLGTLVGSGSDGGGGTSSVDGEHATNPTPMNPAMNDSVIERRDLDTDSTNNPNTHHTLQPEPRR